MNPLYKSLLTSPTSLVTVFLLLGVCLSVAAQEDDTSVESLMLSGRAYYETQDYPKAAARFERICAIEPENVEATVMAARSYWNAGDKEAARAKWETYLELELEGEFRAEAEQAMRRSVAVLNFSTAGQLARDTQEIGRTFADTLTTRLAAVDSIDVVERTQVTRLVGEQRFQNLGWTDATSAQAFGQVLNAEYLVIGNVFREGDNNQASVRVISTATGRVEGEGFIVTANTVIDLMSKTGDRLLEWWGYEVPDSTPATDEERRLLPLEASEIDELLRLLPRGSQLEELKIPEEEAERAYFLGLNYLRTGLNSKSAFLVGGALKQFNRVVELAPEFAQGHFHTGLCLYYLQDYRKAQAAFREAKRLDLSLYDHTPLLWWDDFGDGCRRFVDFSDRYSIEGGLLTAFGDPEKGLAVYCWTPGARWEARDFVITYRFRFHSRGGLISAARCRPFPAGQVCPPEAIASIQRDGQVRLSCSPSGDVVARGQVQGDLGSDWHIAKHILYGDEQWLFIDGRLVAQGPTFAGIPSPPADWAGDVKIQIWKDTRAQLDWVLITR
jgi:tetratricopeptide (TPR) repeat protein